MTDTRIPTHIWIEAKIREISGKGQGIYVIHKGDLMRGTLLLKISDLKGQCRLLTQQRNLAGAMTWVNALKSDMLTEKTADDYIAKAIQTDPDLWVIEYEDPKSQNPF